MNRSYEGGTSNGVCSCKQLFKNSSSTKKTIILDSKDYIYEDQSSPDLEMNIILFNQHSPLKWQKINKLKNKVKCMYSFLKTFVVWVDIMGVLMQLPKVCKRSWPWSPDTLASPPTKCWDYRHAITMLGLVHIYHISSTDSHLSIYSISTMPLSSYPCHGIMKLLSRQLHQQHNADDDIRLAALKSHPWLVVESSILVFWTICGV